MTEMPDPEEYLDWDRERDGKMADHATRSEPETYPYDPDGDDDAQG